MKCTPEEVIQYVEEENVKFIRLAFCDVYGQQKNLSIMPGELRRAFSQGMAFDASAIAGFGGAVRSDLFLRPDSATLAGLPWRPENGRVVRMFCDITRPDGSVFEADTRHLLQQAIDIAPADKGENVRREICLTLEQMGIRPESSHHEEGPGQNEIDFRYSDALTAADDAITFRSVVQTIAARSGLWADFSPKPLSGQPGSGLHINLSVHGPDGSDPMPQVLAGILRHAYDLTAFCNPCRDSYRRLGSSKAPGYITWSSENRSQLIRLPAAQGEYRRLELRSPDPTANPYIAFALLIWAGLDGIVQDLPLPPSADLNLYEAPAQVLASFRRLPATLEEAQSAAAKSPFIRSHLPAAILSAYTQA